MTATDRFEFITVTASAYDAPTLATKLTAHSAEGWEVVAIVPTGGELTAFCRRAATGTAATTAVYTPVSTIPTAVEKETMVASTPAPQAAPAAQPAQVAQPAQTSQAAPAGWYADPSGRYELRYWDGTAWTEHVARSGQQFTDPPVA